MKSVIGGFWAGAFVAGIVYLVYTLGQGFDNYARLTAQLP